MKASACCVVFCVLILKTSVYGESLMNDEVTAHEDVGKVGVEGMDERASTQWLARPS